MGASYPIIHSGFRCRRPDPDAHQCLLVVGWDRATARTACWCKRRLLRIVVGDELDFDRGQNLRSECPLWVTSRHSRCPLYPQKRTSVEYCQKQTYAVQHKNAYSV